MQPASTPNNPLIEISKHMNSLSFTTCNEMAASEEYNVADAGDQHNKMKEMRRIAEERVKAIEGTQFYYNENSTFTGSSELSWFTHIEDHENRCRHWKAPDDDKAPFF